MTEAELSFLRVAIRAASIHNAALEVFTASIVRPGGLPFSTRTMITAMQVRLIRPTLHVEPMCTAAIDVVKRSKYTSRCR